MKVLTKKNLIAVLVLVGAGCVLSACGSGYPLIVNLL